MASTSKSQRFPKRQSGFGRRFGVSLKSLGFEIVLPGMKFRDRRDAGRQLAIALARYHDAEDVIVVALPRGGVVVGAEVAKSLHLPLDIVVPRKIGAPGNPEYAIGAITETDEVEWSTAAADVADLQPTVLRETMDRERAEAIRRLRTYRAGLPPRTLAGKTVILVDDGIATGMTMRAAIRTIRAEHAARIILAVPVAAAAPLATLRSDVEEVVCLHAPEVFGAVGAFYGAFGQTSDEEVITLMREWSSPP